MRFKQEIADITVDVFYAIFYFYSGGKPDIEKLKRWEAGMERQVKECVYGK